MRGWFGTNPAPIPFARLLIWGPGPGSSEQDPQGMWEMVLFLGGLVPVGLAPAGAVFAQTGEALASCRHFSSAADWASTQPLDRSVLCTGKLS